MRRTSRARESYLRTVRKVFDPFIGVECRQSTPSREEGAINTVAGRGDGSGWPVTSAFSSTSGGESPTTPSVAGLFGGVSGKEGSAGPETEGPYPQA